MLGETSFNPSVERSIFVLPDRRELDIPSQLGGILVNAAARLPRYGSGEVNTDAISEAYVQLCKGRIGSAPQAMEYLIQLAEGDFLPDPNIASLLIAGVLLHRHHNDTISDTDQKRVMAASLRGMAKRIAVHAPVIAEIAQYARLRQDKRDTLAEARQLEVYDAMEAAKLYPGADVNYERASQAVEVALAKLPTVNMLNVWRDFTFPVPEVEKDLWDYREMYTGEKRLFYTPEQILQLAGLFQREAYAIEHPFLVNLRRRSWFERPYEGQIAQTLDVTHELSMMHTHQLFARYTETTPTVLLPLAGEDGSLQLTPTVKLRIVNRTQ